MSQKNADKMLEACLIEGDSAEMFLEVCTEHASHDTLELLGGFTLDEAKVAYRKRMDMIDPEYWEACATCDDFDYCYSVQGQRDMEAMDDALMQQLATAFDQPISLN